jgi:CubicO group peptidase (beta-lactamase class C family)
MRVRRSIAVALAIACALTVTGRLRAQRAANDPVSVDRLGRIGQMLDRRIAAHEVPGAVALVAQNGRIVYFNARGVLDLDTRKPLAKDSIFQLASLTKPVTTAAILMLVEEGKVRLTDPVSRFIPGFRPVTIRQLLTHTSGIVSAVQLPTEANATLETFLPRFATEPLEFEPGSQWKYSNTVAFDLLARVVEVASGQPYDRFLRGRIFEPLGMHDTAHALSTTQKPRLATRYNVTPAGLQKASGPDTPLYFGGGWGLNSTAQDYFRFAQMLLNKGELDGRRLLSPRAVELMQAVHIPDTLPGRTPGTSWGLGVRVITDAANAGVWLSNGSFGWTGASGTHFWIDPTENLVAVLMAAAPTPNLKPDFETAVIQALPIGAATVTSH